MSNFAFDFEPRRFKRHSTTRVYRKKRMKALRNLYYDYYETLWYTLGLMACVLISYFLSRFIPVDVFEQTLCPVLHGCMALVAIVGAILLQRHIFGIVARRTWQIVLIVWALVEINMFVLQGVFGVPTMIFDHTLTSDDLVTRDLLALLFLAYPLEVLRPHWLKWWKGGLIILPSLIIGAVDHFTHTDLRAPLILYPVIISLWLFIMVYAYRKRCEENFSTLENTGIVWMRNYLMTLVIMGLSYFYLCAGTHPTRAFTQELLVLYLLIANTAQIILRSKPWLEENAEEEDDEEEDPLKRQYREKLEAWMENERPYLNPDFRLLDLMKVLPMNRTYLSNFINGEYNCNFYQYVNNYRIAEAKRLMRENPDMKMQDVASQSGFSSSATFSRSFAKEEGCSPTEWAKNLCNS